MGAALPLPKTEKAIAGSPASTVVVLRGAKAMAEVVPAWEDLAANALEPNPFHEPWLLLPALELLGGHDAGLLTVWSSGKLGAVLPVRQAKARTFPLRTLSAWRHPHSMVCTPLVRSGGAGVESLRALLQWLARGGEGAGALELPQVPAGGAFHAALADALNAEGLAAVTTASYSRALLRRAADAESYVASALSRNMRRTLERKEEQLRGRGALAYRALAPSDDVSRWITDFLQVEASGWKGQAGSAMACTEANTRFATIVMSEAFRRRRLMMSGIDLDGRPIARLWCFLAGEGSYGFKTAYDEAFKSYMPGFMAEVHNIREFHARPGPQWMDSYTEAGNTVMDRMWRHRLVMQTLLIGGRGLGGLAAAARPLLRWGQQAVARKAPSA